jgi:hypothetical protein
MKIFVCNAFSLSMLDAEVQRSEHFRAPVPCGGDGSSESARNWLAAKIMKGAEILSAVGHEDTAAVFSNLLGRPIAVNRISVKLDIGDETNIALIGQLQGPRLPTGATELPTGASIEWWLV